MIERKNSAGLTIPQHQPLTSILVIFWKSFGGIIRGFGPVLIFFIISGQKGTNWLLIFGSIGLAGMSFVTGLVKYWYFMYHVDARHLIVLSGAVTKKKQQVPFDRIQSIRFEQTWLHQLLKLYAVHVETAGSNETEIIIPALTLAEAEALKGYIEQRTTLGRKRSMTSDDAKKSSPSTLLSLSLSDLMKLGLTANHLRTLLVVLGVAIGLLSQLGEFVPEYRIDNVIDDAVDQAEELEVDYLIALIALPIVVIATLLISTGMQVIRYYRMRLAQSPSGYHITYGLFNRREQIAPYGKIQMLVWSISPLRRILGLYQLKIRQAVSGRIDEKSTLRVTGATPAHIEQVRRRLFSLDSSWTSVYIATDKMIARYFIYYVVIPAIVLTGLALVLHYVDAIWGVIMYVLLASWGLYRHERRWTLRINDDYLYVSSGMFSQRWYQLYVRKLQGCQIRQTPYQVRHDLADVVLHSAAGTVRLPYLRLADARDLLDLVIYRVEVDDRGWM